MTTSSESQPRLGRILFAASAHSGAPNSASLVGILWSPNLLDKLNDGVVEIIEGLYIGNIFIIAFFHELNKLLCINLLTLHDSLTLILLALLRCLTLVLLAHQSSLNLIFIFEIEMSLLPFKSLCLINVEMRRLPKKQKAHFFFLLKNEWTFRQATRSRNRQ
uniref:Uncharacterized protein n=1 Tax=Oryza brachyantha TaxID=4533 RepID=J3L7Z1_ORYBR